MILKKGFIVTIFSLICFIGFSQEMKPITKIAFGSCSSQNANQEILYKVVEKQPDVFVYLGDNIYGDTKNMKILKRKYDKLGSKSEFQFLRKNTKVLATWDDHDYGKNDAGKEYIKKEASKEIFLEFWKEPKDSERYQHKGIYHSELFGEGDRTVQIILLDTRTFRDKLKRNNFSGKYKNIYRPNENENVSFLGEEQWKWLEEQLEVPATIRIIASSNQFSHEYNGLESWRNMPLEHQKILNIIKKTETNGVLFISGDVHYGEISKFENDITYPIYDITSSGLTKEYRFTGSNKYRIGKAYSENNFGVIQINWEEEISLLLQLFDRNGISRVKKLVPLSEISF